MPDSDSSNQARGFIDCIQTMLTFAEQQDDSLLAAKLEEVRITFVERHLPAET